MMWGNGWGWFFGMLMMLLFWGGLVAVVVVLVRGSGRSDRGPRDSAGFDPLEILEERYARGEISEEEFEERRRVLRGNAA